MTLAAAPQFPRRLVYLGTPDVAVPPLRSLHAAGFDIALVVTRPDKRRGRGSALVPSPVKAAAVELGLPVSEAVDDVLAPSIGAELGVVVAYGRLIKPHVLARVPMINLHFSLLPRWRGAAPVERAILAGDRETGACVMALEEGLDTGPIYAQQTTAIRSDDTLASLRGRLVELGTEMIIALLRDGMGTPVPQSGTPTYAAKIEPEELVLDFSQPAAKLRRVVALGGAYTSFRGKRLKVHAAREIAGSAPAGEIASATTIGTGAGLLELIEVQPEGKARMAAVSWANGAQPRPGERLGG